MSVVFDGKDILKSNAYLAISMKETLDSLLSGKKRNIPARVLKDAKSLFSVGMDAVKLGKNLDVVHKDMNPSELYMTYRLLADMLRATKKDVKDVDSELEKLTIALEALTPDGRQVAISKENYNTLRDIFGAMYKTSCGYSSAHGEHSPYSIGTFDDSDE